MNKYQKPIRSIRDEVIDVDWDFQKREQVTEAYDTFFETLSEVTQTELKLMLY